MIASGSSLLSDPARFAQAIGILEREELSPRDERWFRWLNRLTWSALLLSVAWLIVLRSLPPAQLYVLMVATFCYLAVVPAFCLNLPLFIRLFFASRRQRTLCLTRPLARIALRVPGARVRNFLNSMLAFIGLFPLYGGVVGLSAWNDPDANLISRLGAVCLLGLGLSCMLNYPVGRARRRLRALSMVRQAVDQSKDGAIDSLILEALFAFERDHISQDRQEPIGNAFEERSTIVRMSDPFLEAVSLLPVDQSDAVYSTIQELSEEAAAAGDDHVRRVGDLRMAIRYERDRENDELTILALEPLEGPLDEGERN